MQDVIPIVENDFSWISNISARNLISGDRQLSIGDTGADGSAVGSMTRFQRNWRLEEHISIVTNTTHLYSARQITSRFGDAVSGFRT
jgi:hypothetical protein